MYIFVYMYIFHYRPLRSAPLLTPPGLPIKCFITSFAFGFAAHCLSGRLPIEQSGIFNSICINHCRRRVVFFADVYGFHVDGTCERVETKRYVYSLHAHLQTIYSIHTIYSTGMCISTFCCWVYMYIYISNFFQLIYPINHPFTIL